MKKAIAMLIALLFLCCAALAEPAESCAHAAPGDIISVSDGTHRFEALLFTAEFDNWDLLVDTYRDLIPPDGALYLLRLAGPDGITHAAFEAEIAPELKLRAVSSGLECGCEKVVTALGPDSDEMQNEFDIVFYSPETFELDDMELLCGGVLYPLTGLPREGVALTAPQSPVTPEEIDRLNELHRKVRSESGQDAADAVCAGNVIVAIFTAKDDADPEVLTAASGDDRPFPAACRAESLDDADWAAIIYPTFKNIGYYSMGGAAYRTTTWLSLIHLATGQQYDLNVATADPPQTLINSDGNGASGEFRPDEAIDRLTELVECTPKPQEEPAEAQEEELDISGEPASEASGKVSAEDVLAALDDDACRVTYEALLAGEVIQNGSKGDAARGLQQTLIGFGQSIVADGSVGTKTLAALNAVQAAFGLELTDSVDAAGYEQLLPRLLISTNPDAAAALFSGRIDGGEYEYMCACAMEAKALYYSAKCLFEVCSWGDWEARAAACVQPWPTTGQLYKNPDVPGNSTQLTVQFNSDEETALLVKIYTQDDTLARMLFIGGTGKATTSLPAGTYIIKDGIGQNWYGDTETFGEEGRYEVMTFVDGSQEVELKKNYASTITVNVEEYNPDADSVGSLYEDWEEF